MKKNLKKVISAGIALALSVGSVAMAAPTFSDVANSATYAEAVNTLAALGVISGYEDGTFKPDDEITRAEVSTMVVAALNRKADADGAKGTTKFADVNTEAKAWASGFVNIGVAEGFISGYEDGTFKPDNNVTYAEIVSMLVRVAGYGRYAEYLGGWPNGYLSVGNDKGITKGVSAGSDVAVTRAQVAQMIYNTVLDVNIVESTTLTTDSNGNLVPEMTIMDGKNGNEYKTLLTEKFDAYYVEGYVSETNRTDSTKYDADEVQFTIEYTENYDDSDVVIKKSDRETDKQTVKVGDTDAAANIFTYASAIIQIDEYDDAKFITFTPSGKNDIAKFDTTLIDDEDYDETGSVFPTSASTKPYVRYYSSKDASKSTKYNLDDDWQLYVNGVSVTANQPNFEYYVLNNKVGTVELIDQYKKDSKADGNYDIISVNFYATAKIGSINSSTGKISFNSAYGNGRTKSIELDDEDDNLSYEIIYNGEKVERSALRVDDIISIAFKAEDYDTPAFYDALERSSFYEIIVSRDTAEGKFTGQNAEDEEVTIGGNTYEFVRGYADGINTIQMSDEYTLYLDAFGRIFDSEILASSAKLAVLDRYTKATSDDYYKATLYTTDGSTRTLEVDTSKVTSITIGGIEYKANEPSSEDPKVSKLDKALQKLVYVNGSSGAKNNNVQDRVVEYKVSSSSGRIIDLKIAKKERSVDVLGTYYRTSTASLGNIKFNSATKIIDAIDYVDKISGSEIPSYSDLSVASMSAMVDGNEYKAYAYGTKNSDGTYPMVLVTYGGGNYTYETKFAVLNGVPGSGVENGDDIYTMKLMYDGEKDKEFVVNDDYTATNGSASLSGDDILSMAKGDVIVFRLDGDGHIKEFDVIASAADLGLDTNYTTFLNNAFAATSNYTFGTKFSNWTGVWTQNEDPANSVQYSKEVTRVVFGPVIENKTTFFTLGSIGTATSATVTADNNASVTYSGLFTDVQQENGTGGVIDIDISNDTNVYVYDFSKSSSNRLAIGGTADLMALVAADSVLFNDGDYVPWDGSTDANIAKADVRDGATFALVRMVDGEAKDVLVVTGR